jgi:hypothetical protein
MDTDGVNGKEADGAGVGPSASTPSLTPSISSSGIIADVTATPGLQAPSVIAQALKLDGDTIYTGALLKQVRESQRITLKEISERTRISVASLAALEEERYEDLPNARVYVRGFVRCLAVEIGLDKDQVSRTYVPRWEAWFADNGGPR